MKHPFAAPSHLPPELNRVDAYWRSLLRGQATIPFWDDAKLTALPDLADRLFLIDVFERPERFRFGTVGAALNRAGLEGQFLDEIELGGPFAYLKAQCAATVEAGAPTLHRHEAKAGESHYARLLLPMWGEGRIGMLLGAVEFD